MELGYCVIVVRVRDGGSVFRLGRPRWCRDHVCTPEGSSLTQIGVQCNPAEEGDICCLRKIVQLAEEKPEVSAVESWEGGCGGMEGGGRGSLWCSMLM